MVEAQAQATGLVFSRAKPLTIAHLLVGATILSVMWPVANLELLLGWFFSVVALSGLRLLWARRIQWDKPTTQTFEAWRKRAFAIGVGFSISYGVGFALMLPSEDFARQTFLVAVLCGSMSAASFSMSPILSMLYAYVLLSVTPVVVAFFLLSTDIARMIGVLLFIYAGVMATVGRANHRQIIESIRLRFENLDLVEEQRAKKNLWERTSQAKSLLIARVSHELRTPLNSIIGFAEILEGHIADLSPKDRGEYASHIRHSGAHLLRLVDDLLDLSRAEADRLEIEETPVDLEEPIGASLRLLQGAARKGQVTLSVEWPEDGAPVVMADPLRLKQIMVNLLSNAVKFTPEGGRAHIAVEMDRDVGVTIRVVDTGIGMDPQLIPIALMAYQRVSQGRSDAPGAGLGLYLARKLVDLHNGVLRLESAPGEGTTVTVTLPPGRILDRADL